MRHPISLRAPLLTTLLLFTPIIGICGSKMEGTYTNTGGMVTLDLKSGGKANFTMMGESHTCTDKVSGDKLSLDCRPKGDKVDFTINSDGSLNAPGFIGVMKKSK